MQTALFQAVPFPPVVLWLVVSTLLVGIIISVRRRRSSRAQSPRAKTECCNGTSAKKIQTDSYHSVELLGTSADLRLTISKETIDVQCDCHCCNTDFQDLVKVTCADRPLEIVPLETGLSPVHDAARDGWEDTLKLLFEYHADLDVKDLQDMTPAHLAAEKGHVRILEFLRAKSTDLWAKNRRGQTPRDLARIHGKTDVTAWFRGSFPEQHAEQQGQ
uniref:Uncharacterized protein n=1 Tax=Branchiostoma floridae TaxID=7739 RepID=C3Y9W2_BRAFL|eukprot:XP_002606861.1 hypothetical protein BRAFLDRAFT_91630 [Branchiostoma floridae]